MMKCILKIEGKIVNIKKSKKNLQLYATDKQKPEASVQMYRNNDQVAFSFLYDGKQHFIKVESNTLKLVHVTGFDNDMSKLAVEHWFERIGAPVGEQYRLKSVANSQFVTMTGDNLALEPIEMDLQTVTHESP